MRGLGEAGPGKTASPCGSYVDLPEAERRNQDEESPRGSGFKIKILLSVPSSPAPSEVVSTRFYFPHFVHGNDAETTFVISNSSAQDAEVRLTAYGDNGSLLSTGSNPLTLTLPAQSQSRFRVGDVFKIPNQRTATGWVKAESTNPQLSALMLISLDSLEGDKLDGLGISDQVAKRMVFSAVFQGSDTSTGIALANPEARSAHLKANLYSDGKLVNTRELQIPSYGHRAWSLNEIFPSNSAAGHVEIDSDVGLVGFEAFSQLDRWSATSMQLPGEVSEFIFPIPPLDKSSWAGIAIANLTAFDMELTLTASSTRLSPVAGPVKRIIKPHGELISVISDLFSNFPASGGVITIKGDIGVARVFGIKPAFSGLAVVGREDSRALASFALESE